MLRLTHELVWAEILVVLQEMDSRSAEINNGYEYLIMDSCGYQKG
jgi:hypothetical protein